MKKALFFACLFLSNFSFAAVCPPIADLSQSKAGEWQITKPLPTLPKGASWMPIHQDEEAKHYHILTGLNVILNDSAVGCLYSAYPDYWDMIVLEQVDAGHHYVAAPGSHFIGKRCESANPADCAFLVS